MTAARSPLRKENQTKQQGHYLLSFSSLCKPLPNQDFIVPIHIGRVPIRLAELIRAVQHLEALFVRLCGAIERCGREIVLVEEYFLHTRLRGDDCREEQAPLRPIAPNPKLVT